MKHVKTISRVNLSRAQAATTDIIAAVVSILTALASLLGIILPGVEDKQK